MLASHKSLRPASLTRTTARAAASRPAAMALLLWVGHCLLTTWCPPPVHAVPGDLDPTFAGFADGGLLVEEGRIPTGMAVQPDERIVVVGSIGGVIEVKRYLPDGATDPSFDQDGVAVLTHPAFGVVANAVAVQPDLKIVVVGYADAHPAHFVVARLTPAGALDSSFDGDGWVTTDFDSDTDVANAVLVQPDGKIVVAGQSLIDGDYDFSVARYLTNGALDTSFSGDGKTTVAFGGEDSCNDAALQDDGRIVLAGTNVGTVDNDFAVARLHVNGTLDAGFNGDGKYSFGFGGNDLGMAVAIAPDAKIVVAGRQLIGSEGKIARLTAGGSLDGSFDGDGLLTISTNGITDVQVQPDLKIVAFGSHVSPDNEYQFAFHRLNANASLDATFDAGQAFIDFGPNDFGDDLALLPDGRMIGSGYSATSPVSMALVRLWPDGSFDSGGHQTLAFDDITFAAGSDEDAYAMAVQTDGKIVVAGTVTTNNQDESDFAVARFSPEGILDSTFGDHGRVAISVQNIDVGRAVAIQPDGKIVVAGYTGGTNVDAMVARLRSDGTLDNTFGFGGFNVLDFLGGPDYIQDIAIAPDGKIVVAGTVFNGGTMVFGAARFNSNGTQDNSFDIDAHQLFAFPSTTSHWASAVLVQPDRKIIIGGQADGDFALVRLNENGSVDFPFGGAGTGTTITDMGGFDGIRALVRNPINGWFYAAGGGGANSDFAIAQYRPTGVLNTCPFPPCNTWQTGKAYANWGGSETAFAVDFREDGQVLAAGCAGGVLGFAQFNAGSNQNPLLSTTDFVGAIECEGTGEEFGHGGSGVEFVGTRTIVAAATQVFNTDRNLGLARFETRVQAITGIEDSDSAGIEQAVRLHAPSPNPLVTESIIAFNLPEAARVRLALYDVTGRVVRMIADSRLPAGRHQRSWNGTDDGGRRVAAGVYFARLEAGPVQEQRAVVVLH